MVMRSLTPYLRLGQAVKEGSDRGTMRTPPMSAVALSDRANVKVHLLVVLLPRAEPRHGRVERHDVDAPEHGAEAPLLELVQRDAEVFLGADEAC